jgi:hypothetical protein
MNAWAVKRIHPHMPLDYPDGELLFLDDLTSVDQWHHEGLGELQSLPGGGLRLHCLGSHQGGKGCMAFFRPDLPDQISVSYDVVIQSQGGLMINYLAIRGLNGEDLIRDAAKLEPRTGIMANYFDPRWGLQSYHVSVSRFDDGGQHTDTSNWRRNPGCLLVGQGEDPIRELGRGYRVRLVKDAGFLQLHVDGRFLHGVFDRDTGRYPLPDWGKFGFRLIGSDVRADVFNFRVHRVPRLDEPRRFSGDMM